MVAAAAVRSAVAVVAEVARREEVVLMEGVYHIEVVPEEVAEPARKVAAAPSVGQVDCKPREVADEAPREAVEWLLAHHTAPQIRSRCKKDVKDGRRMCCAM